jgi:lipopolysaccharide export system ATP-binding protein
MTTAASLPPRLIEMARVDRAVAQAMAALIEGADDTGICTLNVLASQFRETHLGQDHLGLDEVRTYLMASLLPRLEQEGLLVLPSDHRYGDPDLPVEVAPALWELVAGDRVAVIHLLRAEGGAAQPVANRQTGSSVLVANGLVKMYRRRKVVNDVALRLQQGEIVGLLGPNGAGKTTTFYMIVGLIPPMEGSIQLDGEDITQMPMYRRARQGIGYLSQEPSIFRKLTVEENILAILEMLPMTAAERRARLDQLLDELSIKHLRHNKAYSLSGGERRRLEITRALVTSPKFMMLDEPFAGVDPIAVHDIQTIVAGLRHRGIGVLISDHNVEQTLDIVDRAYIMFDGQVKISGTVRELVYDETVAEIYLGPTLTARLRARYSAA